MADYDRLKKQIEGDILNSSFDRGRYGSGLAVLNSCTASVSKPALPARLCRPDQLWCYDGKLREPTC